MRAVIKEQLQVCSYFPLVIKTVSLSSLITDYLDQETSRFFTAWAAACARLAAPSF